MELKDYRDMYDKMNMSAEMDERIRNAVLEQQGGKVYNMKKHNFKKTAVAAALCGLVLAGGVSAYAATGNLSLLSMFGKESKEVKNNAARLIETEVVQEKGNRLSDYAEFEITEAVCDKNQVVVQLEVKAADSDKYLLIPQDCEPKLDPVSNLDIRGAKANGRLKIAKYAESIGKKCLKVSASVDCKADSESIDNYMKADGTMVYTIQFQNVEKRKKLDYACDVFVYPDENNYDNILRDKIKFTLTDKTDMQVIKYLPVSDGKIAGMDLVVDEVTFEKSDLSMVCNVKYHYTGNDKNWENTAKEGGIEFYMLDENGNMVELGSAGYGGETVVDGKTAVQSESFSLKELPDTITFEAKSLYEDDENGKKSYGKFDVKLAK
ncbi:MAG: DUF4179 domain-containing protein [Clostridium sp.]|nr:DUF4179 domain-containing protein [Clostridium sp.]